MILKGSQRSGARQLATHLLKDENEQIELVELRGFMSDDLPGALDETHAIAKGTKCRQFLFSLSLSPPLDQVASPETFQKAADAIEARLGLAGQPRAIIIHEKEGRRHAHAVWSRIDPETMTARPLPFFKNRLRDMSRELYLEHGWTLPEGLRDPLLSNPLNFTREEWQQAQRTERDPREIKQVIQKAWARSDGCKALASALEESGFILAKGDRRGHVAVDHDGEVYSLSRWTGVRAKEVRERLGEPDDLPSVEDATTRMRKALTPKLETFRAEQRQEHAAERNAFKLRKNEMATTHREAREALRTWQKTRWDQETRERTSRLRTGVAGLWDVVTGRAARTIRENEWKSWQSLKRDQIERDALVVRQLMQRRALQKQLLELRDRQREQRDNMDREVGAALMLEGRKKLAAERIGVLLARSRGYDGPILEI